MLCLVLSPCPFPAQSSPSPLCSSSFPILSPGSSLYPLGAPLPNVTSILFGPPSLPHSLQPEESLSLCYPAPLLPSPPFHHPLIAPPTLLDVEGKAKAKARLADMQPGAQDNVMTRQFSEVMINLCVQHVSKA